MHNARRKWGESAKVLLSRGQLVLITVMALAAIVYAVIGGFTSLMRLVIAVMTVFYALFMLLKVVVSIAGATAKPDPNLPLYQVGADDPDLPFYSVLVAAYQENLHTLQNLVSCLSALEYPADRYQVVMALEEGDTQTWDALAQLPLPSNFVKVPVAAGGPKTKPKACDDAMQVVALAHPEIRDRRVVLLDAEDIVKPDLLLKGVASLNAAHARDPRVVCIQGRLAFWNPRSGLASPYYWAEYTLHFQWMLRGLARLGLVPPLGGTSNHFFEHVLWEIASKYEPLVVPTEHGNVRIPNIWDPYNVTEDADLAMRIAKLGYRIAMDGSVTLEEAPASLAVADNQKRRWLGGYGITALVHMRRPFQSMRQVGPIRWAAFELFTGGTPVTFVINPLLWATTLLYLVSRLAHWPSVTGYLESLFSIPWVYYLGMLLMVFGNAFVFYQKLITPLRERQYGLCKFLLLTPAWWAFTSYVAWRAMYEMINPRTRSFWHKTPHGHDALLAPVVPAVAPASVAPAITAGPQISAGQVTQPQQQAAPDQQV